MSVIVGAKLLTVVHKALDDLVPWTPYLILCPVSCSRQAASSCSLNTLSPWALALRVLWQDYFPQLFPWLTLHSLQVLFKCHHSVRPSPDDISRMVDPTQHFLPVLPALVFWVSLILISHTAYCTYFSFIRCLAPGWSRDLFSLFTAYLQHPEQWLTLCRHAITISWMNVSDWSWRVDKMAEG